MVGWLIIAVFVGLWSRLVGPTLRQRETFPASNDLRRADETLDRTLPEQSKVTETVEGVVASR